MTLENGVGRFMVPFSFVRNLVADGEQFSCVLFSKPSLLLFAKNKVEMDGKVFFDL